MRHALALCRQGALHQCLRRNVHQADDRPRTQVIEPLLAGILARQQAEGIGGQPRSDAAPAADIDEYDNQQDDEPYDEDHHLQEVGERNRPQTAHCRVDENDQRAANYPDDQGRPCQGLENETEGHEHRTNPGDVGKKYGCRNGHGGNLAVSLRHVVGDREYAEAPQQTREEKAEKEQCKRSAERIGDHSQHAVVVSRTGGTHHRAAAEPRCNDRSRA